MDLISDLGANVATLSNEQLVFVNAFISNMKNINNNNSNNITFNPFLGYSQNKLNPFLAYSQPNINLNNSSNNLL